MTSANVIEYNIFKGDEQIGSHSENVMCISHYEELLRFEPLSEHTIIAWGYDEEEEYWENEEENLELYLKKMCKSNKIINSYFDGNKNILSLIKNSLEEIKVSYPVGTEFTCALKGYECIVNGTPYIESNGCIRVYCTDGKKGVIKKLL